MLRLPFAPLAAILAAATTAAIPAPIPQDLEPLATLIAHGDEPGALRFVRKRLQSAQSAWQNGETMDPAETATLEAELAILESIGLGTYLWRSALEGIDVGPWNAPLAARIAWLRRDVSSLAPLSAWEFVGPFDNERGRGMNRPTPAEKNPSGGPYDGKVRQVDWRSAPAPGLDGILYLGRLVRPSDQVCVVARTWVLAEAAREATLLLGASEEVRVWWNGAPVYEALGGHDFGPDGHAISLGLSEGWNELTVKIGGKDAAPRFSARLVDPASGAPVSLTQSASAPEGAAPLELVDPGRRLRGGSAAATEAPGARSYLARQADPRSVLARAALKASACARPRKDRPGHADAQGALIALPDSLAAAQLTLNTMRVSRAIDVEEDVNPWLDLLNETIEKHGPLPRLSAQYAWFAVESQDLPGRALRLIDESSAAFPEALLNQVQEMRLLALNDQDSASEAAARRLAQHAEIADWPAYCVNIAAYLPKGDPLHWQLIELAAEAGAEDAIETLSQRSALRGDQESNAQILETVEAVLNEHPYKIQKRVWAARRLLTRGASREALALIDEALSLAPEDEALHSWRARVLMDTGELDGAARALERAIELDPSSADEQRLLEFIRRQTGASADAAAEAATLEFHERFVEPLEDIAARFPADAAVEGEVADAPREVLVHRQVVSVGADGKARHYRRIVERVLSEAGVRELDTRSFRAYRGDEDQRVLSVRVLHPDGSIDEGPTRRGARITIDLPPLAVGDVVDIQWRRDDIATSIFGSYFGLDASFAPDPRLTTREAAITVLQAPELELTYHLTGEGSASGRGAAAGAVETSQTMAENGTPERTWLVRDLQPRRSEALEPPPRESVLRLQASTYADWPSFGNWWWNLIREEIAVSPEMSEKVAELTGDKETQAEKLRAIYDFIVTEVRYNAWEFGVHGYQPYSAPVIFSRRFGDCKDKAILMRAMLSEVGIEAWPVLIQSESRRFDEDHSLPLVAHFNHCIAYVPAQEGVDEMFLDGTARLHPLEVLPDADRGARVLAVRDDGVAEMQVPFPTADENARRERIAVSLDDPQRPRVSFTQAPKGRWDPQLRYRMSGDDAQRAESVEALMTQRFGSVRGEIEADHPDYEDLTEPLEVTLSAELESVGRVTETGVELPSSFAPYRLVQGIASETERTTDVLLDVPWSAARTLSYRLPKGASLARVPETVSIDHPDLGYERSTAVEEGPDAQLTVTVEERFEIRSHRIRVERYEAFREAARRIDTAQRQTFAVELPR